MIKKIFAFLLFFAVFLFALSNFKEISAGGNYTLNASNLLVIKINSSSIITANVSYFASNESLDKKAAVGNLVCVDEFSYEQQHFTTGNIFYMSDGESKLLGAVAGKGDAACVLSYDGYGNLSVETKVVGNNSDAGGEDSSQFSPAFVDVNTTYSGTGGDDEDYYIFHLNKNNLIKFEIAYTSGSDQLEFSVENPRGRTVCISRVDANKTEKCSFVSEYDGNYTLYVNTPGPVFENRTLIAPKYVFHINTSETSLPSFISVSVLPPASQPNFCLNALVKIYGTLDPCLINQTVYLNMSSPSENKTFTLKTDNQCTYLKELKLNELGKYAFVSYWNGDEKYAGADSPPLSLAVSEVNCNPGISNVSPSIPNQQEVLNKRRKALLDSIKQFFMDILNFFRFVYQYITNASITNSS